MKFLYYFLLLSAAALLCAAGGGALGYGILRGLLPLGLGALLLILALCSRLLLRRRPKVFKWLSGLMTVLLSAACAVVLAASVQILSAYHDDEIPDDAVIVVLGCGLSAADHTSPSLMLQRRLEAAYDYLASHPETVCIVSGGQGPDEYVSEARAMADFLIGRGIREESVWLEDASTSTEENIAFSKELIAKNHTASTTSKLIIVTDGFHQFRAQSIAQEMGFACYSVSSHAPAGLVMYYWLREIGGVALQVWL